MSREPRSTAATVPIATFHASDLAELRARLASASTACIRGSRALELFARARREWLETPAWRERAERAVTEFHGARAAGATTSADAQAAAQESAKTDLQNLAAVADFLDPALWSLKAQSELGNVRALDGPTEGTRTQVITSLVAHGTLLHVCPGNSYLGGLDSVLHGIFTGNVNLAKLSRNTPPVLTLLTELLESYGLPRGQLLPVTWDSGFEKQAIQLADATVVWGSDEALRAYRAILPGGARLIEYGPKLSFSLISASAWAGIAGPSSTDRASHPALMGLVADACRYEQVSCSSSQLLLLECEPGTDLVELRTQALDRLGEAFAAYAIENPPAGQGKHQAVELLKSVERAKLQAARDPETELRSGYPDWLLIWKPLAARIEPSPLMRTWLIYPFHRGTLAQKLAPIRTYLQTASLLCADSEQERYAEALWNLGVNRVVDPGRSTEGMGGAPHDGSYILREMCRVVSLESPRRAHAIGYAGDTQLDRLRSLVATAAQAPLYRERLDAAGITRPGDARVDTSQMSEADFSRLPWLTKEDLYRHGPPTSSELLTTPYSEAHDAYLFTTGGSTGAPKYALYSKPEWDEVTDIFCREFRDSGLTARDRVGNLFVGGGLWSGFIATTEGLAKLGCLNLPMGNLEPVATLELMRNLQVTALFGLPSTLLRLAHAQRECASLPPVRLRTILYGGEHMSEPMRRFVAETFGAQLVKSGSYAAVDAGCIGYQCLNTSGGIHHALENYCRVEICDEETGLPCAPGDAGEIIVTNLSRRLFPILRLRTGDRGRAVAGRCACGSSAFTFELLGRSDDMVRVGGANVFVSDVEKVCQRYPGLLTLIYQVRAGKRGVDDALEILIEGTEMPGDLRASYLAIAEDLRDYLDHGSLRHFDIRVVAPGSIAAQAKTGKIRRVVDER